MKKLLVFLCATALVFGTAGLAGAALIDFETPGLTNTQVIGDYEDFNFGTGKAITETYYGMGPNFFPSDNSGDDDWAMYNWNGFDTVISPLSSSSFSSFDLTGFWICGYLGYSPSLIYLTALSGIDEYTLTITPVENQWIWVDTSTNTNFMNIDTLTISYYKPPGADETYKRFWMLDDFTYNPVYPEPDPEPGAPVPEPATMLLLGAGMVGMAAAGRKKFFKKG